MSRMLRDCEMMKFQGRQSVLSGARGKNGLSAWYVQTTWPNIRPLSSFVPR